MSPAPPRDPAQRKADTVARLESDVDLWIATASPSGDPCLVPLSFLWDGHALVIATVETNPTGRNLLGSGVARVALGVTRDVSLAEVEVGWSTAASEIDSGLGDAFAAKSGFDPRGLSAPYRYFGLVPTRLLAWREANELKGRVVLRDGSWLV